MNVSIRRLSSAAVLSVLCACTVGASLAWACAPSSWGFSAPATPEATPTPGVDAPGSAPSGSVAPAPSGSSLAPAEATPSPAQSESRHPARSVARQPAQSPANAPSGGFAPRRASALVQEHSGVQSSGPVTSSRSASPGRARAAHRGEAKNLKTATAPSRSTATLQPATHADTWSGGRGKSVALMPSASNPPAPAHAGGQLGFGVGLLGLGLVGLFAGLAVAETRRRRSLARR